MYCRFSHILVVIFTIGGHYVAYAKNNQLNTWYEFNDSHVTSVSTDTVQNSEGYLLFYK